MSRAVRVLSVCTSDDGGGAERVARGLHQHYRASGMDARFAVGAVRGGDPGTFAVPNRAHRGPWARAWNAVADMVPSRHAGFHVAKAMRGVVAEPARWLATRRGEEDFDFPGTAHVIGPDWAPDVVHLHNLHGGYFDLRVLPAWSQARPTVLSLHDAWMLSGHCAHPFGCERWRTGCGECPALWIHPAVPRDATAFNWRRKAELYSRSSLHVGVPCEWLARRVRESALAPAIRSLRVIPYGIDLAVYDAPIDRRAVRRELGLDMDRPVFVVFANALEERTWKDGATFRAALRQAGAARTAQWVALGAAQSQFDAHGISFRGIARGLADRDIARWFQAADAYVHPARADTFPLVNLEAQACGAPVVATAVDGVPEQIVGADIGALADQQLTAGATGVLVRPGDATALARALDVMAAVRPDVRAAFAAQASRYARARFDSVRHAREYASWLRDLVPAHAKT